MEETALTVFPNGGISCVWRVNGKPGIMKRIGLLACALLLAGCLSDLKLLTEVDNRIGDYTFDRNARVLLVGKIDNLRLELFERSVEQNYEGEYKAFKKAQAIILESADVNKDKHISVDEIYGLNVEKVKEDALKQDDTEMVSADMQVGDYTVDKNAHHRLMGQIDALRQELFKSKNQTSDGEYQAYKEAQDLILEQADTNGDHHITPDEIYNLDMQKVRATLVK